MSSEKGVTSKNFAKKMARKARRKERRREEAMRIRNGRSEVRKRIVENARKRIGDEKDVAMTILTNSGIVSRLREDVPTYTGFELIESDGGAVLLRRELSKKDDLVLSISIRDLDLLVTTGPFVRALVRLNTKIDPRNIRVVVDVDVECEKTMSDEQVLRLRRNIIHRILRNSMGSALLVNLHILVPKWMWSRGRDIADETVLSQEKRDSYPSVNMWCKESYNFNTKAFQPKIILSKTCRYGGIVIPTNTLDTFDSKRMHLDIHIKTRTTTFQLTPVLFQLQRLGLSTSTTNSMTRTTKTTTSKHIVCVEKEPNLHRVVNLFNVYDRLNDLVLCTHEKYLSRYRVVVKSDIEYYRGESCASPRVFSIDKTYEYVRASRKHNDIVAFDLHDKAFMLRPPSSKDSSLLQLEENSIVCWGFESTGIPSKWIESDDRRVQIESRSSLNLASAISIALHSNV